MAYIGNAKTPLLLASNVRDDLIPGDAINGRFTKTRFALSQEVPGGEESNVTVVRRKFLADVLIENTTLLSITNTTTTTTLTTTDNYLAAALSIIQPKTHNYEGDDIQIEVDGTTLNATVISVKYTRDEIEVVLNKSLVFANQSEVSLVRRYYGGWEILDPKTDYEIKGDFNTTLFNREIELVNAPQLNDVVYVLHRGDATYNFVPSPYSVGIEQLSNNLKNFRCDRYVVDSTTGSADTFNLSQASVNEKALLVTVNGIVKEGDELDKQFVGDWKLVTVGGQQTVVFHEPLVDGDKIRILHLGFVSGNRRAAFAPGQEPASIQYRSITEEKISDGAIITRSIKDDSVSSYKLQDSSVSAQKILLNASQNDGLRISYSDDIKKLIGVENSGSSTQVYAKTNFVVRSDQHSLLNITGTEILPGATNTTSLGSESVKFSSIHLSGSANVGSTLTVGQGATIAGSTTIVGNTNITGSTNITGDANISGTVNVVGNISVTGTVDTVDVSALYQAVQDLQTKVSTLIPVGTIMASANNSFAADGVWLVCDGTSRKRQDFPELFAAIQYTFGGSGDDFNIPDLVRRVPVGKSSSDNIGDTEGLPVSNRLLTHTHINAAHTHDLSSHTHSVPGHKHIITETSSLKIESTLAKPSGGHTTSITHSHGSDTLTTSAFNTAGTAASTFSHDHNFTHGHTGTTDADGIDHYHTGSTTGGANDGAHSHAYPYSNWGRVLEGAYSNTTFYTTKSSDDYSLGGGGHSHNISTGWAINPSNPLGGGNGGYLHRHNFTIPSTTTATAGPNVGHSLNHTHKFTVAAATPGTSTSDGTHGHIAGTFSGSIGNDSASDGNSALTSGGPSTNTTGSVVYPSSNSAGQTSETKTPYILLNFIIKAKNS